MLTVPWSAPPALSKSRPWSVSPCGTAASAAEPTRATACATSAACRILWSRETIAHLRRRERAEDASDTIFHGTRGEGAVATAFEGCSTSGAGSITWRGVHLDGARVLRVVTDELGVLVLHA